MVAKRFFYASAAVLCLALAFHFGAVSATAQVPGNPLVSVGQFPGTGGLLAASANGDLYYSPGTSPLTFSLVANVFGGPTPVQQSTWGRVKRDYRGAAQPAPQGR